MIAKAALRLALGCLWAATFGNSQIVCVVAPHSLLHQFQFLSSKLTKFVETGVDSVRDLAGACLPVCQLSNSQQAGAMQLSVGNYSTRFTQVEHVHTCKGFRTL